MPATWQEGETIPPILFTVTEDGQPFDFTDVAVALRFALSGQAALWEKDCLVDEPETAGKCRYEWDEGDLAISGSYEAQLKFTVTEDGEEVVRLSPIFEILVRRSIPPPEEPTP